MYKFCEAEDNLSVHWRLVILPKYLYYKSYILVLSITVEFFSLHKKVKSFISVSLSLGENTKKKSFTVSLKLAINRALVYFNMVIRVLALMMRLILVWRICDGTDMRFSLIGSGC